MTKFISEQARNAKMNMKIKWRKNSKFMIGSYDSCAMHSIVFQQSCILDCFSTIMHIRFEDVQAVDDKVIFQASSKCHNNFNQREITYRQDEVDLWFFHTAFGIIKTNHKRAKMALDRSPEFF